MNTPEFSRCKVYAFPSPSGVSIFSIRMLAMRDHDVRNSFRPLPGFLSSQLSQSGSPHVNIVSVPFRGFYLLNAKWCSAVIEDAAFPSPSGVSIFSIVNGEASDALWNSWFPSPSGVSIFSIDMADRIRILVARFPSPSGVSIFSIISWKSSSIQKIKLFPSPSGVSIFSMHNFHRQAVCRAQGFRPLPGFLSSQ